MRNVRLPLILALLLPLANCASIISGTSQDIRVTTNPPGATCKLIRGNEVISTVVTPAPATVRKAKDDIQVECNKDGFETAAGHLKSGAEAAIVGNVIIGGLIGWGIDSATGADNKYPDDIALSLVPAAAVRPTANSPYIQSRLQELQQLLDLKLITPEEYATRRKALLEAV